MKILTATLLLLLFTRAVHAGNLPSGAIEYWPQWRGPLATGVAPQADPPTTWSETNHIKWKVKVPGSGSATPIVWGDRVFVLSAVPSGKKNEAKPSEPVPQRSAGPPGGRGMNSEAPTQSFQFVTLCYDRNTGNYSGKKSRGRKCPTRATIKIMGLPPLRR